MRLTIIRENLLKLTSACSSVANGKSPQPLLAAALLEAHTKELSAASTDLSIAVSVNANADVIETGSIAVSARDLHERARAMPEGPIELSTKGTSVTLVAGKRRHSLTGMPADDFPALPMPRGAGASVSANALTSVLRRTAFAICQDPSRGAICCLRIEMGGGSLRASATDGHRIARAVERVDGVLPRAALLPLRAVQALQRILEGSKDVSVELGERHMFVSAGDTVFASALGEGQFPPFDQYLDQAVDYVATVPREPFVDALASVALSTERGDKQGFLRVDLAEGTARISAESSKSNGDDEVPCHYGGRPVAFGVNSAYLIDALKALDGDEVAIGMGVGEFEPIRVTPTNGDSHRSIVMPTRLDR